MPLEIRQGQNSQAESPYLSLEFLISKTTIFLIFWCTLIVLDKIIYIVL